MDSDVCEMSEVPFQRHDSEANPVALLPKLFGENTLSRGLPKPLHNPPHDGGLSDSGWPG